MCVLDLFVVAEHKDLRYGSLFSNYLTSIYLFSAGGVYQLLRCWVELPVTKHCSAAARVCVSLCVRMCVCVSMWVSYFSTIPGLLVKETSVLRLKISACHMI